MKRTISLRESELKRLIAESVKRAINEALYTDDYYDYNRNVDDNGFIIDYEENYIDDEENYIDGHYIDGQTMLADGKRLAVCTLRDIRGKYSTGVMFGVYINNKPIGYFINDSPMIMDPSLEGYIEDIKKAIPKLEHLFDDGVKFDYEGRFDIYYPY